jgi:hypothetical protein
MLVQRYNTVIRLARKLRQTLNYGSTTDGATIAFQTRFAIWR